MASASSATLKSGGEGGGGAFTLIVHCARTPATAMATAGFGPSSNNAIRSAAYDTDSVEPLLSESGRLTFQIDVRHAAISSPRNRNGSGNVRGNACASAY